MILGPVTLGHYLSLGAILFALSVIGIFLNRKNLIVLLMAIELMPVSYTHLTLPTNREV